jgi:hypothetical protein
MLNTTETKAVIDAFMMMLATTSFSDIRLRDVAEKADVPLAKLADDLSSRLDLFEAFAAQIDEKVLAGDDPDMAEEPPANGCLMFSCAASMHFCRTNRRSFSWSVISNATRHWPCPLRVSPRSP